MYAVRGRNIMPATITHAYFAKDVFDILPSNIKNLINYSRIKMFGQSMDSLMFYNLFSVLPGKNIREFCNYFHRNKSQDYFINLITFIKENNLSTDMDVCSFLAGMICHYVLDSNVHPYIIYKTGFFDKNKKNTYKYNRVHDFMETFIDNDMIRRREKINPYKFRLDKFCFDIRNFSDNLNNTIDYSFKETFGIDNMSKIYFKSLKQMKYSLYLFRRDPYGIKKNCYKLVDTFTTKKMFRFEAISYHHPLEDKHNYLNSEHSLWRNPASYNITSTESFVDLYVKSIKLAKVLICASFDYINNKNIELDKIFTNASYVTGLDCTLNKELKYFQF